MSEAAVAHDLAVRQTPEINMDVIKKYICPKATDQEAFMFMQLCKAQGLNPFLREAYLIKYGDEAATIITGKDTFTKRADRLPQYDGFKAGVIVLSQGKVMHREGSFFVVGEELLGGWAEVFRKDRSQSFRNEVSLKEYERKKKDGSLMSNWRSMPATMIRKVALVQSLREAFPDEFGGLYSPEEMPVDASALPVYSISEPPTYPTPEKHPLKEPAKKVPVEKKAETPAELSAWCLIKEVTHKDGKKKDGTEYRVYAITDEDGTKYGTFSETFADLAQWAKENGAVAEITYVIGQYGNKIVNLTAEEKEAGAEG